MGIDHDELLNECEDRMVAACDRRDYGAVAAEADEWRRLLDEANEETQAEYRSLAALAETMREISGGDVASEEVYAMWIDLTENDDLT